MSADQPAPRYYLQFRANARRNREDHTLYFYQIWERLEFPWLVRESDAYATELEARQAGENELRHFFGRTSV
jgi:hypothetical protein